MFLNSFLLDPTVIDLMSIVHMDKIWVEVAKKLRCRRLGGGGWSVISDTPGGGGGSKKGEFLQISFKDGPLDRITRSQKHEHYLPMPIKKFLHAKISYQLRVELKGIA